MNETIDPGAKNRLAYSSINFGFCLMGITITGLLMYYYTDILELPLIAAGAILFFVRLGNGIINPAIGHFMDRRTTKSGKYRGYVLYWALPACVLFVLMFNPNPFAGVNLIVLCLLMYMMFSLAFSFIEISALPMLESFRGQRFRSSANTFKITGSILATLAASLFVLKLVNVFGPGAGQTEYFRNAILFALAGFSALFIGGMFSREDRYLIAEDAAPSTGDISVGRTVLSVLREKNIVFLICMHLCLEAAMAFKMQTGIYYLKYSLVRQDFTLLYLVSSLGASLLAQPLILFLSRRINLCILMVGGTIISAMAMLVIGLSGNSMIIYMGGNCLYGLASAFPANLVYICMADLSGQLSSEKKRTSAGLVNSFLCAASRIGGALASLIIVIILASSNYIPDMDQTAQTLRGISLGFVTLPIFALMLGGFFAMLAFYPFVRKIYPRKPYGLLPEKATFEVERYN